MTGDRDVEDACARLREVLRATRGLGRRELLVALTQAAAGSALVAALGATAARAAGPPPVTAFVYGGAWKKAAMAAYGEPCTKKYGTPVAYQEPYNWAKLRAMHEAHAQQIDVVSVAGTEVILAERLQMMTPLDWSVIDRSVLDEGQLKRPNAIGGAAQSMVVTYSRKKWPGDPHPNSWADFWDVDKFPGRRALRRDVNWTLEAALKADGVPEDSFYPIDVERAFRSLDRIKPHVKTWWSDNSLAQQLMEQEEVDLIMMANGRASDSIVNHKAQFAIVWNEALCDLGNQGWFSPVGCPNPKGAMQFLDIVGRAEAQAIFAKLLFYAPQNPRAYALIEPELARELPSYPDNLKLAHRLQYDWWADNLAPMQRRFEQWLQS